MRSPDPLPRVAGAQLRFFSKYVGWYLRRNFHAVHLLRLAPLEALADQPLLICLNHPSWWDPLIGLQLTQRLFPFRTHYAPIAAAGLAKYRFMERLGFFGIEPGTRAGAARFLDLGAAVLRRSDCALWITPQGEFTDSRTRPVTLENGVGHLPRHADSFVMLPVALEYAFWNERYLEAFACIGVPLAVHNSEKRSPAEWTNLFSAALETTQDRLAARVQARDASAFEQMLSGSAGTGGVYDLWRSLKARAAGRKFDAGHGSV